MFGSAEFKTNRERVRRPRRRRKKPAKLKTGGLTLRIGRTIGGMESAIEKLTRRQVVAAWHASLRRLPEQLRLAKRARARLRYSEIKQKRLGQNAPLV